MNEADRDSIIKEARMEALSDMRTALNELSEYGGVDAELQRTVRIISEYVGRQLSRVGHDRANRHRVTHKLWDE